MLAAALLWLVAINLWTLLRFWQDKRRAIAGGRRIPERDLLGLALLGGSPGAFAARRLFRHKTRKQPFSLYLVLIVLVQMSAAIGLLMLAVRA
ncbi:MULTISPECIES: DUF1294 domain-containing protein [Sphingomonas]|uniref:Uncharacterized membrane protein YsdA (DUF1294 family) n=1 Tax=Sphingomonas kyeonggiensis TaxID=1268553 RepID=A0A7W7K456_9SPHN|nr:MULTISPECIES: DUF1294 domain-containing protein [Sphingomonas]MBB4840699.1 uncharacterized membrane protein YsdA (DUF1294 family) [Sphingomonas kyeonggiensis]WHU01003.1 DUF1294 domain-containing protein [Sphingomonas sp. NIBR02145]